MKNVTCYDVAFTVTGSLRTSASNEGEAEAYLQSLIDGLPWDDYSVDIEVSEE